MAEESNTHYEFEKALVLQEAKRYRELVQYVLPYASSGDADAQVQMGFLYSIRLGVFPMWTKPNAGLRKLQSRIIRLHGTTWERSCMMKMKRDHGNVIGALSSWGSLRLGSRRVISASIGE